LGCICNLPLISNSDPFVYSCCTLKRQAYRKAASVSVSNTLASSVKHLLRDWQAHRGLGPARASTLSPESKVTPHHPQLPSQLQQTTVGSELLRNASTLHEYTNPCSPAWQCRAHLHVLCQELVALTSEAGFAVRCTVEVSHFLLQSLKTLTCKSRLSNKEGENYAHTKTIMLRRKSCDLTTMQITRAGDCSQAEGLQTGPAVYRMSGFFSSILYLGPVYEEQSCPAP